MKKQNNIDKIFESKLNTQTFELKEAYIADFEVKLDAYNKKRKRFFWFILACLAPITLFYNFVIPPTKVIEPNHHIKSTSFKSESTDVKTASFKNSKFSNHSILIEETNTIDTLQNQQHISITPTNTQVKSISEIPDLIRIEKSNDIDTLQTDNTPLFSPKISTPLDNRKQNTTTKSERPFEIIKIPDVFIDDTIRKQIIIFDTIIKRNTITINDTIKNKVRLFKKKK